MIPTHPDDKFANAKRQKFQCMSCAYENMYSERDRYGVCEICKMKSAQIRMEIAARRSVAMLGYTDEAQQAETKTESENEILQRIWLQS